MAARRRRNEIDASMFEMDSPNPPVEAPKEKPAISCLQLREKGRFRGLVGGVQETLIVGDHYESIEPYALGPVSGFLVVVATAGTHVGRPVFVPATQVAVVTFEDE
jgi:hypothetical protein